jgi:hypothetical protein
MKSRQSCERDYSVLKTRALTLIGAFELDFAYEAKTSGRRGKTK